MNKIYLTSIVQLPWSLPVGLSPIFQEAPASSLLGILPAAQAPIRVELRMHVGDDGGILLANGDGIVVHLDVDGKETGRFSVKGRLLDAVYVEGTAFVLENETGATTTTLGAWGIESGTLLWRQDLPLKGNADDLGLVAAGQHVYLAQQSEGNWTLARVLEFGELQPLPSAKPIVRRPIRVANGKVFSLTPVEGGFEAIQLNGDTWQNLSGKRYAAHPSMQRIIGLDKHGNLITQAGAGLSSFAANGVFSKEIRVFNLVHSPDGGFYMNVLVSATESEAQVAGIRRAAENGQLGAAERIAFPEAVLAKRNLNNAFLVRVFENGDYLFETFDERKQSILTRYSPSDQTIVSDEAGASDHTAMVEKMQGLHTWVADAMGNLFLLLARPEGLEVVKMVME